MSVHSNFHGTATAEGEYDSGGRTRWVKLTLRDRRGFCTSELTVFVGSDEIAKSIALALEQAARELRDSIAPASEPITIPAAPVEAPAS